MIKYYKQCLQSGIDTFIEIGPGKTLSGFLKRMPTPNNTNIININNTETLEKAIREVALGTVRNRKQGRRVALWTVRNRKQDREEPQAKKTK